MKKPTSFGIYKGYTVVIYCCLEKKDKFVKFHMRIPLIMNLAPPS